MREKIFCKEKEREASLLRLQADLIRVPYIYIQSAIYIYIYEGENNLSKEKERERPGLHYTHIAFLYESTLAQNSHATYLFVQKSPQLATRWRALSTLLLKHRPNSSRRYGTLHLKSRAGKNTNFNWSSTNVRSSRPNVKRRSRRDGFLQQTYL